MPSNAFEYQSPREGWKTREWERDNEAWRGREHLPEEWDEGTLFSGGQITAPSHEQLAALRELAEAAVNQVAQMLDVRREVMHEVRSLRRELARLKASRDAAAGITQDPPSWFREAEAELERIWMLSSAPNWDGEGADIIRADVLTYARKVLALLPSYVPRPLISAEPDGYLAFDWELGNDQIFSISVDDSGTVHFAGLFGVNRNHGAEKLENGLPAMVLANLERLLNNNR